MKRVAFALLAVLSIVLIGCGDDDKPGGEDCSIVGDEDGNGMADCDDPQCTSTVWCQAACGNGKLDETEQCDDGNLVDGDGCDRNCTKTGCGNGVQTANEGCDDGNNVNGDGCDNNCVVTGCGNGIVTGAEACDDGNLVNGDGCDNNCTITACGNGVATDGEACDDGNATNGDGCDVNCTVTACGNGVTTGTEACDDGNDINGDGCDVNCTVSACGNGVAAPDEGCDDGNLTDDDGCDSNCTVTGCGNGIQTTGEVCDDGNAVNGDGCDTNCTVSACGNNVTAPDEGCDDGNLIDDDGCDSNCTVTGCGNGIQTSGEICDDGNDVNGDSCDSNCTLPACGNGAVAPNEECDDGNNDDLDGCSAQCFAEPFEIEPNEDGTPSTGGGDNGNDFGSAYADANGAFTKTVRIRARLSPVGDEDVFKFTNTSASIQTLKLDIWNPALGLGEPCGASLDTVLHLRTDSGTALASNDDRDGATDFCSSLVYGLMPGQTVYAHVLDLGDNSPISAYVLEAEFRSVVCGDGAVGPAEQCDDGNTTDGDGCSAQCQIEITSESEPNNTFAEADTNPVQIDGDTLLQGGLKPLGDQDVYKLTVTTGTVVRFETFASLYDCIAVATIDVRLFDAMGTPIMVDTAGAGIRPCGAIIAYLDPGSYYLRVEERGNNATLGGYFLQVEYQTFGGSDVESPTGIGANDTPATADRSLLDRNDVYAFGNHMSLEDADVFSITVPPGGRIRAETIEGNRAVETCESNGIDSLLTLFDQNGVQIANDDDDGRGFCSLIDGSGTAPRDLGARNPTADTQTYYLMVRASTLASASGGQFIYRLQVTIR